MVTANQLVAHVVGDYLLQSDWMATRKTEQWPAAVVHGALYAVPFVLLGASVRALILIGGTHLLIDHWRLARYICWLTNMLAPERPRRWAECRETGHWPGRPAWITHWLLTVTDNLLHVLINAWALKRL
jgi:Protein of unknown function (DUF3307)